MLYFRYNSVKIQKTLWSCLILSEAAPGVAVPHCVWSSVCWADKELGNEMIQNFTDSWVFLYKHSVSQILNPDYFSPVEMVILVIVRSFLCRLKHHSRRKTKSGENYWTGIFWSSLGAPEHWPCLSRPPVLLEHIQSNSMYFLFSWAPSVSHMCDASSYIFPQKKAVEEVTFQPFWVLRKRNLKSVGLKSINYQLNIIYVSRLLMFLSLFTNILEHPGAKEYPYSQRFALCFS